MCQCSGCRMTARSLSGRSPIFITTTCSMSNWCRERFPSIKRRAVGNIKACGQCFQNPKSQFFNIDTSGELVLGNIQMVMVYRQYRLCFASKLLFKPHDEESPEKCLCKQISGLCLLFSSKRVCCHCGARRNTEMDLCGTDDRCAIGLSSCILKYRKS